MNIRGLFNVKTILLYGQQRTILPIQYIYTYIYIYIPRVRRETEREGERFVLVLMAYKPS